MILCLPGFTKYKRLMPGKTWRREELAKILDGLPLQQVRVQAWQTIYDLVWAQKVASSKQSPDRLERHVD